jgi:hypothetical protein
MTPANAQDQESAVWPQFDRPPWSGIAFEGKVPQWQARRCGRLPLAHPERIGCEHGKQRHGINRKILHFLALGQIRRLEYEPSLHVVINTMTIDLLDACAAKPDGATEN